jgi:hypothetical protein
MGYGASKYSDTPMSNAFKLTMLLNKYLDPLTMDERDQFRRLMNKCIVNQVSEGYDSERFNVCNALLLYEKIKNITDKVEKHFIKYLFERYPYLHEWEEERKYLGLGSLYSVYHYKTAKPGTRYYNIYQQTKKLVDNFKNIQRDLCDRINVGDVILMKDNSPMFDEILAKYDIYTKKTNQKSLKTYGFKVSSTSKKIDGKIYFAHKILEKPQIDNE